MQVHDFRGAAEPSTAEFAEIEALRAKDERARQEAAARGAPLHYRLDLPCPTAKLSTGHSIPLVGLGTWCVSFCCSDRCRGAALSGARALVGPGARATRPCRVARRHSSGSRELRARARPRMHDRP